VLAVLISLAQGGSADIPTVRANGEILLGDALAGTAQGAVFKGIPFAAPPLGNLRWAAPQAQRPRPGAQSARQFAAACLQDDYNASWYAKVMKAFGANPATFVNPPFSEDCLYLNVWTPDLNATAKLPVMVWIHGGANVSGWSFEPNYLGRNLAVQGRVVLVSIAYRLGVFGFISHPELSGAPAPANFGLLDQIAALQWVRDNIAGFGGDATNVTVFGESAGGADIGYLLTAPASAGLFRRAISQSGGYFLRENATLVDAQVAGTKLSRQAGAISLTALRARSSAEVFNAAKAALPKYDYGPVIDGITLTQSPAAHIRAHGLAADLLIGSNEHEWYMYVDGKPDGLEAALRELPAAARAPLRERAKREPSARHAQALVTGLADMGCPPYLLATAAANRGHRSWVYRFTRVRPGPGGAALLAYHGAEIPYVFDTHDGWFSADAAEPVLTNAMLGYWSNFARTGDPNGAGLVRWRDYEGKEPRVQELGVRIRAIESPDGALCGRLSSVLYP
jgi:para-nitrobenzyl esterase